MWCLTTVGVLPPVVINTPLPFDLQNGKRSTRTIVSDSEDTPPKKRAKKSNEATNDIDTSLSLQQQSDEEALKKSTEEVAGKKLGKLLLL